MSRKKVDKKNRPVSISLPEFMIGYVNNHPKFNLSQFVQIHLSDYILVANEVERMQKEEDNDKKTVN